MKCAYSLEAVQDLMRVREFVAQHSPSAAARIAFELLARIEQLRAYPEIGHVINQPQANVKASIRDFTFGNYIVRYVRHAEVITILRIWHHYENRK